jgi:hypothetical protein
VVATSCGKSAGASRYAKSIAFAAVLSPLCAVARALGGTRTEEMGGLEIRNSMACLRVLFFTHRPHGSRMIRPVCHDAALARFVDLLQPATRSGPSRSTVTIVRRSAPWGTSIMKHCRRALGRRVHRPS